MLYVVVVMAAAEDKVRGDYVKMHQNMQDFHPGGRG